MVYGQVFHQERPDEGFIIVSMGGFRQRLDRGVLNRFPQTRLGRLRCSSTEAIPERCHDFSPSEMEFYFDRNPCFFSLLRPQLSPHWPAPPGGRLVRGLVLPRDLVLGHRGGTTWPSAAATPSTSWWRSPRISRVRRARQAQSCLRTRSKLSSSPQSLANEGVLHLQTVGANF